MMTAPFAALGSSPGVRRASPIATAMHGESANSIYGHSPGSLGSVMGANGALASSPAGRGSPAGRPPTMGTASASASRASLRSSPMSVSPGMPPSPASVSRANPPLTRTTSGEPATVKIGFQVGGGAGSERASAKPPIGMLRAELAGEFTCDVFDSEAYRRALTTAPEIFAEPTVREAFDFTAKSHAGPGLGPHFDRCVDTAITLAKLGMDAKTVAVGLLHDTLDVTSSTKEDLRERFSDEVVALVEDVTRVHRVSKLHRASGRVLDFNERAQFRAMLLAMTDARVVIVKLAARLIKMRNLASAPQSQQQAFADETLTIYAPLAARLGIFSVKNELEDLTFKWMNPQAYAELSQTLDQRESIVAALNKLDEELSSRRAQVVDLCGRQKSVYSVYKKMLSKNQKLEDIMDLRAIRIIVADGDNDAESEQTCRETLEIALSTFQPVEGRSKDYIANPKANGYQSLHAVVRDENETTFEIQIRSASMHRTAEFGVAAHWRYKEHEKSATSAKVDQQIQWARFMLTWQNELDDQQKIRPARVAHAVDCGAALRPCMFPTHSADCAYSREEGFCQSCEVEDDSPNYIITVVDGAVAVREIAQNSTLADLKLEDAHVPGGARSSEFYRVSSVRVNKKSIATANASSTTLKMGDVIEVNRTRILSPNKSWDEADDVSVFEDLNLEIHALPKTDAVDRTTVRMI